MRLIFRILANAAAILIAVKVVPGFIFTGTPVELLIAGAVLGLINALIKPIIQLIALPVIFLTLGFFNIIINIALLLLAAKFLPYLKIETFLAAFLGVVILAIMNHLVTKLNRHGDINKF
ncbi:MAG TPA: hypothetical protein DIT25_04210 [Candidatus Moranbacteria bacterium]|nr:hypothetical protein [Candidatus Moranbacteria bacterium]